ncbi:DNA replication complex GINS protein SLD5 [Tribolium castaneum]|uniref:DNA replication complex GINS protein SLD5 n=1 Tax=Tribolium castaneum TaxID=7070 RepID=D6WLS6_TRICA|nr:PREDICTED: DNA replication complex GINS protein SLD5 [Tribolium castaneum]EFA03409.1 DNA replication complex GINS protein SLD5-like Protein [Tribolium castaneum]|eukprot:XP_973529.1 PREDICTED: DNA replication complex GINS protein SLD5 [Tribolium castaneum]
MDLELEDLENTIQDDDDDNVQLTSAELIEMMEEVWVNEKFAPEILPHKQEVVDCVLGQISYMEKNLETLPSTDFKKGIHQLEVDRIRFLVASYLRHRLEKIETYVLHILKEEEQRGEREEELYLTEAEQQFAIKYKQDLEQHFENATNFYPGLPFEDWKSHIVAPNMNSFVFLKAKTAVEGVVIDPSRDDDEVADLTVGSQMILSYNSVTDLVKKGDVQLI